MPTRPRKKAPTELTPARRRIIEELARDGATDKVVAARLHLTTSSVKFHISDLMDLAQLEHRNRAALVLWWIRVGRYRFTEEKS